MNPMKSLQAGMLLLALSPLAFGAEEESGKIFRTTDENGQPVFSDQGSDTSDEVELNEPTMFPGRDFSRRYQEFNPDKPEEEAPPFKYARLEVTSPSNNEAIRSNPGDVTIRFVVEPAPPRGHTVHLVMDGEILQPVRAPSEIALNNVDRGTHQVHLRAINSETKEVVQEGETVSFTILRHSIKH